MTGLPRPPRGPLPRGWRGPEENSKRSLARIPYPPEGFGPLLESFRPTFASSYTIGFGWSLSGIALMTLGSFGFWWMHTWWLWLGIVPWPFVSVLVRSRIRISAGADWLMCGKSGPVHLYELTVINLEGDDEDNRVLKLEDRQGKQVSVKLRHLQYNRELWDLVYLGLLHSVQAGPARTNTTASHHLDLKVMPSDREWVYPDR
ncbi:hypothetical protein REH65_14840 [Saccharopolyspora sp. ID03-671]|uniref:hypothetical protein n=1 Tax=Saccharopolyspora sp. ID03-671 TaxID=3073066 RepID=UPI00324B4178